MIITVTLNPALDNVLVLDRLLPGETNRVQKQYTCVGGKGTHVSLYLNILGIPSIAIGTIRGETGERILGAINRCKLIDARFQREASGNSRTNYVILDKTGANTIIAEKGPQLTSAELEHIYTLFREACHEDDYVVISGDVSNQNGSSFMEDLLSYTASVNAHACLDVTGDKLRECLKWNPFFIKPNLHELSALCGEEISDEPGILQAIRKVINQGASQMVVSCGNLGSYAYLENRLFRVQVPDVQVINTAGCGDALVSGLIAGFSEKLPIIMNLIRSNAIAVAAAMSHYTDSFDPDLIENLSKQIIVTELTE